MRVRKHHLRGATAVSAIALMFVLVGGSNAAPTAPFQVRMVDGTQREKAACDALKSGVTADGRPSVEKWEGERPCRINHVVATTGPKGGRAFIVFFAHGWSSDEESAGKPLGHFVVFNSDGRILPWFLNANVLKAEDRVIELPPPQPALVVFQLQRQVNCHWNRFEDQRNLREAHVVSLANPDRAILSIVAGPVGEQYEVELHPPPDPPMRCEGDVCTQTRAPTSEVRTRFPWSVRVSTAAKRVAVELGPMLSNGKREVRARYEWNAKRGAFEGPSGSAAEQFLRYDNDADPLGAERFAVETGAMPADCLSGRDAATEGGHPR